MRSAALDDALATVAPIVTDVRERGDAALIEWTERLDGNRDDGIRVDAARLVRGLHQEDRLGEVIEARQALHLVGGGERFLLDPGSCHVSMLAC